MDTLIPALETYQYTSLQSGDSTFRILKLSRYQGPELECELLQPSLSKNRHTPYEALSYVWGSAERVECIVLNRKRFWVTDNLYSALQCLRQRDRDRYLWIDAICINQADKGEQSRQVQQMGAIFKLAERVLFWLGKATPEIITLMDALNQPQMTVAGCDIGQLTLDENRWDDYRIGLRQLLNRQWFTRVWILQEAANAQEATVCCGTFSIPAEAFAHAPSLIREEPKPHCQAVLNIMPGTSRSETWWGQERDLCTLLRMFQSSKATDERDKIYALLGMSTCSVDKQSIDIDYQTPTHEVVHKVMTYLLQSTPFSVHEMLNLMNNFITLDTIYFVPAVRREEATEILFPHLQSGRKLSRTETCHSQAVKLMLGLQTSKDAEHQKYDNGLQVIPWGSVEQHVKLVVVHDKKKAVLKAALEGYGQIVKRLLHMELGDVLGRELEESALQEAIEQEHIQAVHTLLHQSPYLGVKEGRYCKELQAAACKNTGATMKLLLEYGAKVTEQAVQAAAQNMSSGKDMMALLLDQRGDEVKVTKQVVQAAAQNTQNGKDVIALLLDRRGDEVKITEQVVQAAAQNTWSGKDVMALLLDRRGDEVKITEQVVQAAAQNTWNGKDVMTLLLDRRGDEVKITKQVVQAAAQNMQSGKDVMALLLDRHIHYQRGDEVKITEQVVQAAAQNTQSGKDVIALLLDRRGREVKITQEVAIAAAKYGNRQILAFLLGLERADIRITQEVAVAAAGNESSGKELIKLLGQIKQLQVTEQAIEAAANSGQEDVLHLFEDMTGVDFDKRNGSTSHDSTMLPKVEIPQHFTA
ncbi:HET-domain-containing protein [Ophiobolus disseminans]|uniref:HET-domain-containing protein n=1 Tax=Ophiobolus disseminans TaxID=1469910 RepID=A0A6A7AGV7_9PLEO|nr:HET-domain-containing protein [Ophiobolus disseminans]